VHRYDALRKDGKYIYIWYNIFMDKSKELEYLEYSLESLNRTKDSSAIIGGGFKQTIVHLLAAEKRDISYMLFKSNIVTLAKYILTLETDRNGGRMVSHAEHSFFTHRIEFRSEIMDEPEISALYLSLCKLYSARHEADGDFLIALEYAKEYSDQHEIERLTEKIESLGVTEEQFWRLLRKGEIESNEDLFFAGIEMFQLTAPAILGQIEIKEFEEVRQEVLDKIKSILLD
jgi:hypothetical protein